ncbi:MAG: YhbY family RNA-binding protein [archaeon]
MTQVKVQIGKNKVTEGFISSLEKAFEKHDGVRISVLKAGGHDKQNVKAMAEVLVDRLGKNYTYKTIGFTIAIRKWKKPKR